MPGILSVDQITDSSGTRPVEFPNGIVADTWKNSDGTENYKCRAWVNFDGTTTPPIIRASGNVSSVVRNSTGLYTINFTSPLLDANYNWVSGVKRVGVDVGVVGDDTRTDSASAVNIRVQSPSNAAIAEAQYVHISIFR